MRKLLVATTLFLCLPLMAQKATRHAGDWWLGHSQDYRLAYLSGYKSGVHHQMGHDTPLTPFSSYAIRAGVDKFYKDFRNRNIVIDDAVVYVGKQLSGSSPA